MKKHVGTIKRSSVQWNVKDTTIFDKKELIHRNKQKEQLKTLL